MTIGYSVNFIYGDIITFPRSLFVTDYTEFILWKRHALVYTNKNYSKSPYKLLYNNNIWKIAQ